MGCDGVRSVGSLYKYMTAFERYFLDLVGTMDQGNERMLREVFRLHPPTLAWASSLWRLHFLLSS